MGLISRVSSRTYRKIMEILQLDKLINNNAKKPKSNNPRIGGGKIPTLNDGGSKTEEMKVSKNGIEEVPLPENPSIFKEKQERIKTRDPNAIWDLEEVPDEPVGGSNLLNKITPEYDIIYRQKVGADDVFLGLSGKQDTIGDCEILVVRIKLPKCEKKSEMDLDMRSKFLTLTTEVYFLRVDFPKTVKQDKGSAKFNKSNKTLEISVPIDY